MPQHDSLQKPAAADPSNPAKATWDQLTSALAADALDALGHREQCLGSDVRPLQIAQRVVGRAYPVKAVPAEEVEPERPYEGLLSALDNTGPGDVFVFFT